jgi:hypothetical protein
MSHNFFNWKTLRVNLLIKNLEPNKLVGGDVPNEGLRGCNPKLHFCKQKLVTCELMYGLRGVL